MKLFPQNSSKLFRSAAVACLLLAARAFAYDATWTGTTGDFFNPANWDVGVPTNGNISTYTSFQIVNGGTAIIDTTNDVYFQYCQTGDTGTGTGNLVISNGIVHMAEDLVGNTFSAFGVNASGGSYVMYGGTNYYDGPQDDVAFNKTGLVKSGALWKQGSDHAGINNLQFQVGVSQNHQITTNCLLALHGNSMLCVANQVDLGDQSGGSASTPQSAAVVMDGNAQFNVGDGIGYGRDFSSFTWDMAGNSRFCCGNSMGPGNTNGCSNQGFWANGSRATAFTAFTLRDNASIHTIMMKNAGPVTFLLTNHAQLLIYDVLAGSGTMEGPRSDSFIGYQNCTPRSVFTVADHALFSVDSHGYFGQVGTTSSGILYSNLIGGLSIGNGAYGTASANINGGGASGLGGQLIVKDFGTLQVKQGLHLGTSASATTAGILSVVGPNATVNIGDELRVAINLTNKVVAGFGEIEAVITGPAHSTIHVANRAWLTNGVLKVTLQGYAPRGGETYTLVSAGTVDGVPKTNDLSAAALAPGLVWQVSATSTTLVLKVVNTFIIQKSSANVVVSWQNQGATNILQSSTNVANNYSDVVPTATSPYTTSPTNSARFFRLRR